jgi:hypothetical protein
MTRFAKVEESHDRIIIVCSGSSVTKDIIHRLKIIPKNVAIITVNGAIEMVKRCDYWITIDPDKKNYVRMRKYPYKCKFYCGVPLDYGTQLAATINHQVTPLHHVKYLHRDSINLHGLSDDSSTVKSGNSGYAALNLAYLMKAKKILFLGLDGHGGYAYGGQPRDLSNMNDLFSSAKAQLDQKNIAVLNGSPMSTIAAFIKTDATSGLDWIIS